MFNTGFPMLLGHTPQLWCLHGAPPDVLNEIADAIVTGVKLDPARVAATLAAFGHTPTDLTLAVAARRRGAGRTVPQFIQSNPYPIC